MRKICILILALLLTGCNRQEVLTLDTLPATTVVETTVPAELETVPTTPTLPPDPESDDVFVRVLDYIPEASQELMYATEQNFTGQVIYPFADAYLRWGTVKKLQLVSQDLAELGLYLKIWDGFRPVSAQFALWEVCPNPTYVANPTTGYSSHSRGNTIDLTLVDAAGQELKIVNKSLYFDTSAVDEGGYYKFTLQVEPDTFYTFSTWVKGDYLGADNEGHASVGVWDPVLNGFMVYLEFYRDTPRGSRLTQQIYPTAWDDEWHLRSVQFNSGVNTKIGIGFAGAESQMWIDGIALYTVENGIKYADPRQIASIRPSTLEENEGACADEHNLIANATMDGAAAQEFWPHHCAAGHSEAPQFPDSFVLYSYLSSWDRLGYLLIISSTISQIRSVESSRAIPCSFRDISSLRASSARSS